MVVMFRVLVSLGLRFQGLLDVQFLLYIYTHMIVNVWFIGV